MATNKKAVSIIKKNWKRLKTQDPKQWSLRQLAKSLKISPGYLSKILSGQMPLNLDMAQQMIRILKIDDLFKQAILESYDIQTSKLIFKKTKKTNFEEFEIPTESAEWLLKKWYHLCLLDLMTTSDFVSEVSWMAQRLGITMSEATSALKILVDENLAEIDASGKYKKVHTRIRFPTTISKSAIREYHKAQLKRAILELDTRILPKDFNNRLITGLSVSANAEHLQAVKDYLHAAIYEAAEMFSDGRCTEVYQINLQLFPQTRRN